jgi:hypothetical protein
MSELALDCLGNLCKTAFGSSTDEDVSLSSVLLNPTTPKEPFCSLNMNDQRLLWTTEGDDYSSIDFWSCLLC